MKTKRADWPAPKNITALSTTQLVGNLGLNTGDIEERVLKNRQQLVKDLNLPGEPQWLKQTHSNISVLVEEDNNRTADATVTRSHKHPLVILTADCLPITLCNVQGTEIAAIHAGWRGLVNGIVENTIVKMHSQPSDLIAWIGPAICQKCYEVGSEVYETFTMKYPHSAKAFNPNNSKWLASLPQIAEMVLYDQGIKAVYQSGLCTFESESELYSYRRSSQTGRIGTLIWFNDQPQD